MFINDNNKSFKLLFLTSLIWGISFPVIKALLQFLPPLPLLWYRLTIASLVFVPLAFYGWKTSGEYLSLRRTVLITFLGLSGPIASLTLLYLGMNLTYANRAVLIMSLNPLITSVILNWFNRQDNKVSFATIGVFAGLAAVVFEPLLENGSADYSRFTGNLLVLSAGAAWAVYTWLSKIKYAKNIQRNSPVTQIALAFLGGTMALTPIVYFMNPNYILAPLSFTVNPRILLYGILYLSLISSVMGFITFEAATKLIKPLTASRFFYLQALFGIPVSIFFLKEPLSLVFLAATGIITLGIVRRENENRHTSTILSSSSSNLRLRQ
ncbi:DMT family transporter [Candidatus Collierbacteria bacterium]|nr:DMT family transporter [Candidatus Collierbacteria bacterium]